MYDELFNDVNYDWQNINDVVEIKKILNTYIDKYYDVNDDKETWFNKMKEACEELGFCSNMKVYKEDPSAYKGSIADFSMGLKVTFTAKFATPDLYEIMRLLKKNY